VARNGYSDLDQQVAAAIVALGLVHHRVRDWTAR